jgi:hypothetical protein
VATAKLELLEQLLLVEGLVANDVDLLDGAVRPSVISTRIATRLRSKGDTVD